MQKIKVAIFGRKYDPSIQNSITFFIEKLYASNFDVHIFKPYFEILKPGLKINTNALGAFINHEEIDNHFKFFFCIGGDGTFLEAVRFVRTSGVPIIGINMGRLGFLANIPRHEIEQSLNALIEGKFSIEERKLLQFICPNNPFAEFPFAMNEITVQKLDSSLITINVEVNGQKLNTYWADGLIISTPTGSTAYSMSAGGPIVSPQCPVFIISPIASHNLTVRPIVIADNQEINIQIAGRSGSFLTTLDSLSQVFKQNTPISIKVANFTIRLVQLPEHGFFNTIRQKLMWGADIRN